MYTLSKYKTLPALMYIYFISKINRYVNDMYKTLEIVMSKINRYSIFKYKTLNKVFSKIFRFFSTLRFFLIVAPETRFSAY
jgi:hypothetical protein